MDNIERLFESISKWEINIQRNRLGKMRYLCIPDYLDKFLKFIVETRDLLGSKSWMHDVFLLFVLLCIILIMLLFSPVIYVSYWIKLFRERQQIVKRIKYMEKNDNLEKELVAKIDNLDLYKLWCLHGPPAHGYSDDECLQLVKIWIDILDANNTLQIADLKMRILEIRKRQVQINVDLLSKQSHILFIPAIHSLILQLSKELTHPSQ